MGTRPPQSRPLRIAVLTGPFSATYDAQLTALRKLTGAIVEIVHQRSSPLAPFDTDGFSSLRGALSWDENIPLSKVTEMLKRLKPDVILVTSWNHGAYVRTARAWKGRALRVMIMDNQWLATPKQLGGVAISRLYLKPAFDIVFLPNDRQRVFAKKLGFSDAHIWDGVYCCDQPRFEIDRTGWDLDPQIFLYVGRLVASKGLGVLLAAYASYREQTDEPWPLHVVGTGQLQRQATAAPGVVTLGFQQPTALPKVFAGAGCFVLPSLLEPWGIVIHEAASSGLPIICTTACGASSDLVRHGYNGLTVPPGDPHALAQAMLLVASMPPARRRAMGRASNALSRQLTPDRWAATFEERVRTLLTSAEPAVRIDPPPD